MRRTARGARRMAESAAVLVDEIIPRVPVSQAMGAIAFDPAARPHRGAPRTAHAAAAYHPPRHRGLSAQASRPEARHSRHRRGHTNPVRCFSFPAGFRPFLRAMTGRLPMEVNTPGLGTQSWPSHRRQWRSGSGTRFSRSLQRRSIGQRTVAMVRPSNWALLRPTWYRPAAEQDQSATT